MGKHKTIVNPPVIKLSIRIYTDGSAITKYEKPGGWGVYITDGKDYNKGYRGGSFNTTVSRMEMMAMKVAIEFCINYNKVHNKKMMIYSDSQMVVNSINKGWLKSWWREGFNGRINSDIWSKIYDLLIITNKEKVNLTIIHIKGHQKDLYNLHVFGNWVADGLADYKKNIKVK